MDFSWSTIIAAQKLLFHRLIFKDERERERQKPLQPFNRSHTQTRVTPRETGGRMQLQLGGEQECQWINQSKFLVVTNVGEHINKTPYATHSTVELVCLLQ